MKQKSFCEYFPERKIFKNIYYKHDNYFWVKMKYTTAPSLFAKKQVFFAKKFQNVTNQI